MDFKPDQGSSLPICQSKLIKLFKNLADLKKHLIEKLRKCFENTKYYIKLTKGKLNHQLNELAYTNQ